MNELTSSYQAPQPNWGNRKQVTTPTEPNERTTPQRLNHPHHPQSHLRFQARAATTTTPNRTTTANHYRANQMTVTEAMTQTPTERRANCNPVLIGALTGVVAPVVGTVYGIRQRSWVLGAIAWVPVMMWALTEPDMEGGLRTQRKYAFQLASGLLTGAVAFVKKQEAEKELDLK